MYVAIDTEEKDLLGVFTSLDSFIEYYAESDKDGKKYLPSEIKEQVLAEGGFGTIAVIDCKVDPEPFYFVHLEDEYPTK